LAALIFLHTFWCRIYLKKKLSFWRKNLEKIYGSKGSYRQNPQNIEVMALADGMQFHFGMAGSRCVE
jgi:hypothetical protein